MGGAKIPVPPRFELRSSELYSLTCSGNSVLFISGACDEASKPVTTAWSVLRQNWMTQVVHFSYLDSLSLTLRLFFSSLPGPLILSLPLSPSLHLHLLPLPPLSLCTFFVPGGKFGLPCLGHYIQPATELNYPIFTVCKMSLLFASLMQDPQCTREPQ